MAKRTVFTVTAPDGTRVKFGSETRAYSHAVLARPTEVIAAEDGRAREWALVTRVGRLELCDAAVRDADRRFNWLWERRPEHRGRRGGLRGTWTRPLDVPRYEIALVPVDPAA